MADEFDDIDFGDDFDIDEMSLGDEQLSDRTPIQKVTKRFGKAAYDASIGSSSVREKLVEKALPQPFTSGYRTAGDIKSEIDKSLDHLSRELRETKQDAKTAARAIPPMLKGYLPNSIRKKAENWAKADVSYGGRHPQAISRKNSWRSSNRRSVNKRIGSSAMACLATSSTSTMACKR